MKSGDDQSVLCGLCEQTWLRRPSQGFLMLYYYLVEIKFWSMLRLMILSKYRLRPERWNHAVERDGWCYLETMNIKWQLLERVENVERESMKRIVRTYLHVSMSLYRLHTKCPAHMLHTLITMMSAKRCRLSQTLRGVIFPDRSVLPVMAAR